MAFTSIIALAGGAAASTALVVGAITEVGLAMTVVGAVTGSKDLMKIGGIMSLVGGIGGMVAGAAGGAAAAGGGALTEAGTDAALSAASDEAMSAYGGQAAVDAQTQSIVGGMESAASPEAVAAGAQPIASPVTSAAAPAVAPATQQAPIAAQTQAATTVPGVQAPTGAQAPIGAQTPTNPFDVGGRTGPDNLDIGGGFNPGAPQNADSFFSKFSAFAKSNKELLNTGTQLVGGLLKGASEADMWQQKMDLERDKMNRANSVGSFSPTTRSIVNGAPA